MRWFSNTQKEKFQENDPMEMSPLEAVTYLCAAIQLVDGQVDFQERQEWLDTVQDLFPEFKEKRADTFLKNAQIKIKNLEPSEMLEYLKLILKRVKSLLSEEQIKTLSSRIGKLIEADGIVMTSEMEIASLIEHELGISIDIDEDI